MRRPVLAFCLAGGGALAAVAAFAFLLWRSPLALVGVGAGLAVVAVAVIAVRRRPHGAELLWTSVLDAVLLAGTVMALLPLAAIVRGFVDLFTRTHVHSTQEGIAYALAFAGLLLGGVFFAYAVKYYLSTVMVLLSALLPGGRRNGNGSNGHERQHASGLSGIARGRNGQSSTNGNGYHVDLGYHPFVSVHVAAYNEKRVLERLLTSLANLEYPEYEVILVDDSTDESAAIIERWKATPRFKLIHRASRQGYKGGALNVALAATDPRAEYVVVFDADSMPFPDSIDRFLPYFYEGEDAPRRRDDVAAVQSYQWHVLNKSESWLTEAVRAEYAGSYMVERPFQDAIGSLKMIAGTAYMIRADVLREVGWGTSLTEDWELTLKLYARGWKVAYTPWAETPAECVATFSRLARQRMRWAEGHTHNVRRWFWPIMLSPFVSPLEKLEFVYDASYYLQAALFVVGSVSWFLAEVVFHAHVPGWTAVLGWSLLFSNIFALPLMNLGGLVLEEAPARDLQGVLGALVLSFALVPFQGWAALKGLLSRDEGPWFRTPKTGRITDEVHHLRRLRMLRQWLLGVREPRTRPLAQPNVHHLRRAPARGQRAGWIVAIALVAAVVALAWAATKAPVSQAAGNPLFLHGTPPAPCTASSMTPTAGAQATPCSIQSQAGGVTTVWGFTNLPAQTISAGVWTFQMYWSGGTGSTSDTVSITVGVSATSSCAGFAASIPNGGTTFTATYGASTANTTSPLTVTTSASQAALTIPAGGSLCMAVTLTHSTGGKPSMLYDGASGVASTQLVPPSTVVPELLLPFAALAILIPVAVRRRR